MCGIVGKLYFDERRRVDRETILSMREAVRHRGPDAVGIHLDQNLGLGFRRLAIIDLRPEANQPMTTPDGRYTLVFNGEIYNYLELREELSGTGYRFRTRSDSEVILALYARYGERAIPRLRGMFAIAIWDAQDRRLLLARDRLGKKPLKYHLSSRGITFGSELKAVLKDPEVPREPDFKAIDSYLTFQYVPHPATGFLGIEKLPQAHYLVVEGGKVRLERYWTLRFEPKLDLSEEEGKRLVLEKLSEAVRIRLMSDVPLGAFLSGGVDSSAIVALMARHSSGPVKTFSIGFAEASHNELSFARLVAERYGTDHHELIVEPNIRELIPELARAYEEPYADSSAVPTYYVSKQTREFVTVVLNGDGGDENFAGYPWYVAFRIASRYRYVPGLLRSALRRLLPRSDVPSAFRRRLQILFDGASSPLWKWYAEFLSYFSEREKEGLYSGAFWRLHKTNESAEPLRLFFEQDASLLDRMSQADIGTYLVDDLNVKVDLASMLNSLEARSPFLDHEFMEFTARLPAKYKLRGLRKKYLLREALRDLLPHEVLFRRGKSPSGLGAKLTERFLLQGKMGFSIPIDRWFRTELRSFAREVLLDGETDRRGLFSRSALEGLLEAHDRGASHGPRIWALLMLELWFRTCCPDGRIA